MFRMSYQWLCRELQCYVIRVIQKNTILLKIRYTQLQEFQLNVKPATQQQRGCLHNLTMLPQRGFALTGGHSGKQCVECHVGTTNNASPECFSCHQANYNKAENHLAQNYPHDCLQCHTTNNWDDADFDHNATAFPLKGAHVATECAACHTKDMQELPHFAPLVIPPIIIPHKIQDIRQLEFPLNAKPVILKMVGHLHNSTM